MAEENNNEKGIIIAPFTQIFAKQYIDYAMDVICDRALADVRDGLKPVHRRILYGLLGLGLLPSKSYRKSARVVGEVLGKKVTNNIIYFVIFAVLRQNLQKS